MLTTMLAQGSRATYVGKLEAVEQKLVASLCKFMYSISDLILVLIVRSCKQTMTNVKGRAR